MVRVIPDSDVVQLKHLSSSKQEQKRAFNALKKLIAKKKKKVPKVSTINNKVKKLELTQKGSLQMARHVCNFTEISPPSQPSPFYYNPAHPSELRPIAFLHQAISVATPLYTLRYLRPITPGQPPSLNSQEAGRWANQPFPLTIQGVPPAYNLPVADYDKYDQLQFWPQSLGVSNDYTHISTKYQMQIKAVNCRGYLDIFLLHPKVAFLRSDQKDVALPTGLPGFTNMSLFSNQMYQINGQYYSCKRIKRKYFNTTLPPGGAAATEHYLGTNPDFDMEFTIKNKKGRQRIKVPEIASGAVIDVSDIPYRQQDWIIISTTLSNSDLTENNHLKFKITRIPVWRDRDGAST